MTTNTKITRGSYLGICTSSAGLNAVVILEEDRSDSADGQALGAVGRNN
jgi:hypothetical protein